MQRCTCESTGGVNRDWNPRIRSRRFGLRNIRETAVVDQFEPQPGSGDFSRPARQCAWSRGASKLRRKPSALSVRSFLSRRYGGICASPPAYSASLPSASQRSPCSHWRRVSARTPLFTLVNRVIPRPLQYPQPDRPVKSSFSMALSGP